MNYYITKYWYYILHLSPQSLSGLNGHMESEGLAKKASMISAKKSKKRNKPEPYLWDVKVEDQDKDDKMKNYSNIRYTLHYTTSYPV